MAQYGLLGKTLSHSWSASYFDQKWKEQGTRGHEYILFELAKIEDIIDLWERNPHLNGLNVTLPYKSSIRKYLIGETIIAKDIGAVNCLKPLNGGWIGHNTDGPAFLASLEFFLPKNFSSEALILGTGGSARAVSWALQQLEIPFSFVSRVAKPGSFCYEDLNQKWNKNWELIINCTPSGMFPGTSECPNIPYSRIHKGIYLYDLVYNPEKTLFLNFGSQRTSHIKNGLEMLKNQADLSWQFWNE